MIAHLQQNVTYLCELWRVTSRDGQVAAYANHTRDLIYDGVTYKASPAEPTRTTRKINLEPDSAELQGVFDGVVTETDLYAGRWRDARIRKDWVCYRDLSLGSALTQKGFVGKVTVGNGVYVLEFLSLSSRLDQPIGDLTSPTDRTRKAADTGVDMGPYTHETTVDSASSRRLFKVAYVQPSENYFQYGLAQFDDGANAGRTFEIKYSTTTDGGTRTQIELHKNTPGVIAPSDAITLYRGYSGTRSAARDLGEEAILNFRGEPDMPLPDDSLKYQP